MKRIFFIFFATLFAIGCSNNQPQGNSTLLDAKSFSEKISRSPNAQILDVRTPEEFDKYLDDLDSEYTAYNEQDYPSVHNLGICLSPITINFNNSDDLLFTNNDLFGKSA